MFYKKDALENFTRAIGKNLCRSLFFNKVAELRFAALLKKRHQYRCFFCEFGEDFKNAFFL